MVQIGAQHKTLRVNSHMSIPNTNPPPPPPPPAGGYGLMDGYAPFVFSPHYDGLVAMGGVSKPTHGGINPWVGPLGAGLPSTASTL